MNSTFRSRLKNGEKVFGTMVTLADPAVAEILATVGFDWLFIDGEHGAFGLRDIQAILQAVGEKSACIVRVPSSEEAPIKQTLDVGAAGVIVPQVNTADQAARVVKYSRYSPAGSRGVGLARAHGYGMNFQQYIETANEHITVIVQAEHIQAVENIEAIVQVEGIDAVQMGPYDLSASMGKMGQINDREVVDAIEHVRSVCAAAKIPIGMFGVTAEAVRPHIEKGYTLIVTSVDTMLLGAAATSVLQQLKDEAR